MTTPTDPQTLIAQARHDGMCEGQIAVSGSLMLQLADALESALQYKAQLELAFDQHRRTQREFADHKAKMVGLLADAYAKGRAFNEDVDDRGSEDD